MMDTLAVPVAFVILVTSGWLIYWLLAVVPALKEPEGKKLPSRLALGVLFGLGWLGVWVAVGWHYLTGHVG